MGLLSNTCGSYLLCDVGERAKRARLYLVMAMEARYILYIMYTY